MNNALRHEIPDISQKMLTSTLRTLEEEGLVTRTVYAEVDKLFEYALCPTPFDVDIEIMSQLSNLLE